MLPFVVGNSDNCGANFAFLDKFAELPSGLRTCQQTGHVAESDKTGSSCG